MATLIINGERASLEQQLFSTFHGESVFTTLKSLQGSLRFWPEHWRRVCEHAQFFDFSLPEEEAVLDVIERELSQDRDQKIRIIISKLNYAVSLEDLPPPDRRIYHGVKVIPSTFQVHPQLARFKTGNYLPYALAYKEAQKADAFEGLLSNNQGFVVDGSRTSLMLFRQNQLIALNGGLEGVMRAQACAFAKSYGGLSVSREWLRIDDLDGQLLLANSLLGVVPVGEPRHPFVLELIEYFRHRT